jgi:hypothetical protein
MNRQNGTRRWFLGALVVMVAAMSLGPGNGVSAEDNAHQVFDHKSKANFQSFCKNQGGTFGEDGLGNTSCTFKDGSWTECDANGNDCWHTPAPRQAQPFDPFDPYHGGEGQVSDDPVGTGSPAPVIEAPLVIDDTRTVAPVDSQGASAAESAAAAAPVEAPVAAEEPMVAEASGEQP